MLIDIRHEASHNELPSLPLLKTAARQALAWLQASYWQLQADHLSACRQQTADLLEVKCCIRRLQDQPNVRHLLIKHTLAIIRGDSHSLLFGCTTAFSLSFQKAE